MLVFPQGGIQMGNYNFKFKTWNNATDTLSERKIEDVEKYLAQFDSLVITSDSIAGDTSKLEVTRKNTIASLQFKDNNSSTFFSFFEALDSANSGAEVHIYHYGDSQIECDRMTGVLREKLQAKFGGHGPGLVSPLPIATTSHCSQSQSENWKRHTAYGFDDGKVKHNKFGAMCSFARFNTSRKKEEIDSTITTEAWFEMRPSGMAQPHSKTFNSATIYFANHHYPFQLTVMADDINIWQQNVQVTAAMQQLSWPFAVTPRKIRFIFKGADSPDIYAVALQDTAGVAVSNIALRGNDGSALRKVNQVELKLFYSDLNARLVILQFGGNAVPYLKSATSARAYGKGFLAQIRQIKNCAPNAAILIIGPSDMSTSVDGNFQTWPFLSELNDGMKEAAFDQGCAFWDMFGVMGGQNSMVSWVANNPPYAGPDYTHFTPAGARKMAELMYKAISDEYDAWKNAQKPF